MKATFKSVLIITLGLFLLSPVSAAQTPDDTSFTLTLKLKRKVWDTSKPLMVDVIFKNTGRKDFYVGIKCGFGFQGYLENDVSAVQTASYLIEWGKDSEVCTPRREDFIRVPAGESVRVSLNSSEVDESGGATWKRHPRGKYTLFVRYVSGKIAPFAGVLLGGSRTNDVQLYVK